MKTREIIMRCVKARVISWLTNIPTPATLPTIDGNAVVIAVYSNGKKVNPEVVRIPNSPRDLWGPDGPAEYNKGDNSAPDDPGNTPETPEE